MGCPMGQPFFCCNEDIKFNVTMTFGLSTFSNGEDIDNVLKDADDKLYQGKQSGKNKLVN